MIIRIFSYYLVKKNGRDLKVARNTVRQRNTETSRDSQENTVQNNEQLLDEVEQNIVICQWRADGLFAEAEGWGKLSIADALWNPDDILR